MFTGIVQAVGVITKVSPIEMGEESGLRLSIEAGSLDMSDVKTGDSIAVQGACMTVTTMTQGGFTVDVSRESLNRTVGLSAVGQVNLEKSLCLGDPLGGHLVSGHVDGLGKVIEFHQVGESWKLVIDVPSNLGTYLAYKGSVAVNGVSLTVNDVVDLDGSTRFHINLIPHTVAMTTLQHLKPGDPVNIEVDTIARYVHRMIKATRITGR
ncbi:riboflavin synthase [Orrella marina]|uniref:Riboflavin synthase n=1 Tax=Orrella marina TaxID=2163011 RepID=A0A2R4XQ78_9BURK|nr:riboflavin synthase [Orrella marina]AWB35899.1 riboflavin synthase [Orrella marina]